MAKKNKQKKLKKSFILFIIILIIAFCAFKFVTSNKYKLKNLGYTDNQITIILDNKDYTEYALAKYNPDFLDYINEDDFKFENIDKYLEYKKDNKDAPINDIIFLINNDYNNTYSKDLMSLINSKYYIKKNLDRYLTYLSNNNTKSIENIITNINSNIDYPFYTNIIKTDLSKQYLLLVNKYNQLESDYVNDNLVAMETKYSKVSGAMLDKVAYDAFKTLSDKAKENNLSIVNVSAYRSYTTQYTIYNNYKNTNGLTWADSYSARAGHSEHQTGLALDVGTNSTTDLSGFKGTAEYDWMIDNCYKYGFILRYPEGKEYITGYNYESWHYRYIGVEAATYIHENNITFEEYYAYFINK